jgi:hypothetical protein
MYAICFDDRELKIAIVGGYRDFFPYPPFVHRSHLAGCLCAPRARIVGAWPPICKEAKIAAGGGAVLMQVNRTGRLSGKCQAAETARTTRTISTVLLTPSLRMMLER